MGLHRRGTELEVNGRGRRLSPSKKAPLFRAGLSFVVGILPARTPALRD
jgi:hypothetical protein